MAPEKPLTKAEITLLILEIVKEYNAEHVKNCPHAIKWRLVAAVFLGAVLGSGLVNGAGAAITKLIIGM